MFPAISFDPYYSMDLRSPRNHLHQLHFSAQNMETENHRPCGSMTENSISPSGVRPSSHIAYHDPDVFALPTHTEMLQYSTQSSMPSILGEIERNDGFVLNSATHFNGTRCGDHVTFSPSGTSLWGAPYTNGQPLGSLVTRETREAGVHLYNDSIPRPTQTPSQYPIFTNTPNTASEAALDGILSAHLQLEPQPSFPIYRPPPQGSAGPFRRRASCAIEYSGIWIDQDELLSGLAEPSGKICVVECRWAQDHSPCRLWIKGDKSSINGHIQKWHAGKPEGDKSQADCRWHGCRKTMLKDSIARHVVGIHLGEVWECQGCGKKIVRNDAYGLHAVKSKINACRTSGALITYSVGAQEIDVRAALDSGRRLP